MAALDFLENIDLSDRSTQVMLAGGVLVTGLVIAKLRGGDKPAEQGTAMVAADGFGSRSDAGDFFGPNNPGVIGWVGNADPKPTTPTPAPKPGAVLDQIFRNGKAVKITRAPESTGLVCPPGYIAAQQPGEAPRCTLVDDRLKKPGQRTSFIPSKNETAFLDGSGKAEIRAVAAAGEGTLFPDTNPRGLGAFGGTVGGFSALPAAVTGSTLEAIHGGENLRQFAGRIYGNEEYWPRVLEMNPGLAVDKKLNAGDVLRTL